MNIIKHINARLLKWSRLCGILAPLTLGGVGAGFLTSCVDTVILPDNKTVDDDYWQKKSEVDAVVATAYAQLRDEAAIRNMIIWGDFRSDELAVTSTLPAGAGYRTALQQI